MGRRIVVTGAGRGLGLGLAQQLIHDGHEVWGSARDPEAATELAAAGPAGVLPLDLGDEASIASFVRALTSRVDSVDTLINNAGMNAGALGVDRRAQSPLQTSKSVVLRQIEVNAVGPMLLTQTLRPLLLRGQDPIVLNISSQLGSMTVGARLPTDVGYNASKSVMNMITVMSATADPEIAYVAIHPGWVQSDMGGPSATLTIEQSAAAVVRTLDGLTRADSGRFVTWEGREHPW